MLTDPELDAFVEETEQLNDVIRELTAGLGVPSGDGDAATLAAMRARRMPGEEPLADTEVIEIPGPSGPIPARIRRAAETRGVYLDIHGGGMVVGTAEKSDQRNENIAQLTGLTVVACDYRLAPEHPFPAGPDDCEAAALCLLESAGREFGTDRVLIGGGSAGAYLAALTLLRLRDRHDAADAILAANLVFGCYDLGMTPSQRRATDAIGIPTAVLELCAAMYLPGLDPEQRRDPEISPLYADLAGMPPALFTVGALDPLLDDSLFMACRWRAAGNEADLDVYPASIHGFVAFPTQMGSRARDRIVAWLNDRLER